MPRTTYHRQDSIRQSETFDDTLSPGDTLESGATSAQDDLNAIRSQIKRILGETDWHSAISGRDLATLHANLATAEASIAALLGYFSVSNATSLSALNAPVGVSVYVETYKDFFVSTNETTPRALTPNEVLAHGAGGNWRWERLMVRHPSWLLQSEWEIDPTSGSDEASGLTGFPIKTAAEFMRRVGIDYSILRQTTRIKILGDLPNTDPLNIQVTVSTTATTPPIVILEGGYAQLATGTVGTFTALNRTVGVEEHNTLTGVGVTLSAYVQYYIRFTSGVATGYGAWIAADLGAGKVRISSLIRDYDDFPNAPPLFPSINDVTPAPGDSFEIVFPYAVNFSFKVDSMMQSDYFDQATCYLVLNKVAVRNYGPGNKFTTNASKIDTRHPMIFFVAHSCDLGGTSLGSGLGYFNNCAHYPSIFSGSLGTGDKRVSGGVMFGFGGNAGLSVSGGSTIGFDGDTLFQDCPLDVGGGSSLNEIFPATVRLSNVAFFGNANPAITIRSAAKIQVRDGLYGGAIVWGRNSAGYGIRVYSGGQLHYSTKPQLNSGLGAGREVLLGGTDTLLSATPAVNAANLAAFVATA